MSTLAERLHKALGRLPHASQAGLSRATGAKSSSVAAWFSGQTKSLRAGNLRKAAEYLHCSRDWLETGLGSPGWTEPQHPKEGVKPRGAVAQVLSDTAVSYAPRFTWEQIMALPTLPPTFRVAVVDDSMAPRVRSGEVVEFAVGESPRPGDGVLVRDNAGALYFRLYRQRRPGAWEAHPVNDAYQALDSERDGLVVVAVLVGVPQQRWG